SGLMGLRAHRKLLDSSEFGASQLRNQSNHGGKSAACSVPHLSICAGGTLRLSSMAYLGWGGKRKGGFWSGSAWKRSSSVERVKRLSTVDGHCQPRGRYQNKAVSAR